MVHYFFLGFFLASAAAIAVMLWKKMPSLAAIPPESLLDQETFRIFALRMAKKTLFLISPKRVMMHMLAWMAHLLNGIRVLFLNLYHIIEALTKKARHTSQRMQWENQWFSQKEVQKQVEEKDESAEKAEKKEF